MSVLPETTAAETPRQPVAPLAPAADQTRPTSRIGTSRPVREVRDGLSWVLSQALPRAAIAVGSRRGDPVALLQTDPALHEHPFGAYDQLRGQTLLRGNPLWATVDHSACTTILRSPDFGTGDGHGELPPPMRRLLMRVSDPATASPVDPPSMLAMDPPGHTRYRRLVSKVFTARAVAAYEERIEETATALLDRIEAGTPAGDPFDVAGRYAALLPIAVICDILGIPERDRADILRWGDGAALTLDPGLSFRDNRRAMSDMRALHGWFDRHVADLRRDPGDDLLSRLAMLEGDDRLTDRELHATGLLVLGAGFETTVSLIGNAVALLARHPEQYDALAALGDSDADGWRRAVEEVLRYESPVQMTLRLARRDTEVAGEQVPEGSGFLVMIGGANRDPAVFTDPHRFDITRPNAGDHLAFSSGIHYCLGASLARQEAIVALRALYRRFGRLEIVGDPVRRPTRVLRGYQELPVRPAA